MTPGNGPFSEINPENRLENILSSVSESKILLVSAAIALLLEYSALTLVGISQHWLAHPPKANNEDQFLQTEMVQLPEEAHLEEKKAVVAAAPREASINTKVGEGKTSKPTDKPPVQEQNQTQASTSVSLGPNHGPVAVFAPPPTIPSYLQNEDLKANVVIDFFINGQGNVTPKLVGSSGNEELDAIALATAKKWQFRPAEKDHKPIDSKVRLRIVFQVQ